MDQQKQTGTRAKEKEYKVKYQVQYERVDQKTKLVYGKLKKPSALPPSYDPREEGDYAPVVFNVHDLTDENSRCLTMMRDLHHRNILHARTVMVYKHPLNASRTDPDPKKQKLFAWVEPYSGSLIDHLRSTRLGNPGNPGTLSGHTTVLPNNYLRNIVREVADGIENLRICGYYHGNFSLESTYYVLDETSSDLTVKLTNFKEGNSTMKSLSTLQNEDWHAVGRGLKRISEIAKEINKKSGYERFDCCQLDDLAMMLLQSASGDLETTYKKVIDHVFFWEESQRKKFFVYRIPMALKENDFSSKLEKCDDLCLLPWGGTGEFYHLVQKMDRYRTDEGRDPYDKKSKSGFVKCISGLYSHEFQLTRKVDSIVQRLDPRLCWKLYSMLPRPSPDKYWL